MTTTLLDPPVRSSARRATYQDVLNAPPNMVAEIIYGRLYVMPRPRTRHAEVASNLHTWANWNFGFGGDDENGWCLVSEPELHLGEDVLVPDIGGWRFERMPEQPDAAYYSISPDWVCEVLSKSTKKMDLGVKQEIYASHAIPYLWIVDPIARSIDAFSLEKRNWVKIDTVVGDVEVRLPPFDAVSFRLKRIWDLRSGK